MGWLYILSEGVRDELFYELVVERITGVSFDRPQDFRLRHGANWKTALAGGRLLLNRFKHWQEPQDVTLILAVDNDRSPGHPGALPSPRPMIGHDLKKPPRYAEVVKMIIAALGPDKNTWPVNVATAVPVEMIESWILHLCDPKRPALPLFAHSNQQSARLYYKGEPPPQLKDLCDAEASKLGLTGDEYFCHAAEQNIEAAVAASPSFKMFVDEIRQWRQSVPKQDF